MTATRKPNRGPGAAAENRAALVDAARQVFGVEGWQAPLSAVARLADVGQGSLYRHFPDRISLALAVVEENVRELEDIGARPDSRLGDILEGVARQAVDSAALAEFLRSARFDARVDAVGRRIAAVAERALVEGIRDGEIAPWLTVDHVLVALDMIGSTVGGAAPESRRDTADRVMHLVLAGLRP